MRIGYTLSSEEHAAARPGAQRPARPRRSGFDFVSISDHFHPWVDSAGAQPVRVGGPRRHRRHHRAHPRRRPASPAPILRIHPAIIAQAAATVATMLPGPVLPRRRHRRGAQRARHRRALAAGRRPRWRCSTRPWTSSASCGRASLYSHHGALLHRRERPPLHASRTRRPRSSSSGAGPKAAELAGRIGDGYWGMAPERRAGRDVPQGRRRRDRCYAQVTCCWAADEERGPPDGVRDLAERRASPGSSRRSCRCRRTSSRPVEVLTEEQATKHMPCGPDPEPYVEAFRDVRRRRLRPPLLPPDRPRPGRLPDLLRTRAAARGCAHCERNTPMPDAITSLRDDHKRVEKLFKQFEKLEKADASTAQKRQVVDRDHPELSRARRRRGAGLLPGRPQVGRGDRRRRSRRRSRSTTS